MPEPPTDLSRASAPAPVRSANGAPGKQGRHTGRKQNVLIHLGSST